MAIEAGEAILIMVVGIMLIQGTWLSFLTYLMYKKHQEKREREKGEAQTFTEEIFLLHRSGLLIRHQTRRLRPDMDSDILSGMLSAVQEFVKDSFRGERGDLNEMKFGEMRITICQGENVVLAAVTHGMYPVDMMPQLRRAVDDIEQKYGSAFKDWDGDMDKSHLADDILMDLIRGKYKDEATPKRKHLIELKVKR